MAYSAKELQAISYVLKKNNWKLSLSKRPVVFFVDQDGRQIQRTVLNIIAEYNKAEEVKANPLNPLPGHSSLN